MSYILDALKESQAYRDIAKAGSSATARPAGRRRGRQRHPGRTLLIPGAVALIAIVTSYFVLQPQGSDDAVAVELAVAAPLTAPMHGSRSAYPIAEQTPPLRQLGAEQPDPGQHTGSALGSFPETTEFASGANLDEPPIQLAAVGPALPLFNEMPANYRHALGPLHIDVHVYDPSPKRRFVMLNQRKYREGQSTADGAAVETITADRLVLAYQGRRFCLPL